MRARVCDLEILKREKESDKKEKEGKQPRVIRRWGGGCEEGRRDLIVLC